ncbi:MAG: tryptophan--tRNA ligase [Flavobacteriales bacterium]|nr:tryptophan--tRNA ligase [Flavobacteriales bacterium]|tara:strand:+ start:4250 stop:5218 length:969 start_codon:yes stop_codon:yes gene_type:complete
MARILTGIQSSGVPHLGNILGAIQPAIKLSKFDDNESLFFIADLHSLTTIKNSEIIKHNTFATAATWLAFGFNTDKNIFYRQSDIPEVTELMWILNCFTQYPMLANAHSFKDKSNNLADVNSGLFNYPVLMAADILLYDADIVPVGKDQLQHLEMTRDIAGSFNHQMGDTLTLPKSKVSENMMIVPGIDGKKMSKSYNNTINIFTEKKLLKKQIMSIVTDSLGLEDVKNPSTCNVFKIFKLLANEGQIKEMENKYMRGGFGYGHAKNELLELIIEKFSKEREIYFELMSKPEKIEQKLKEGSEKARKIASSVLLRVKNKLGI